MNDALKMTNSGNEGKCSKVRTEYETSTPQFESKSWFMFM